MVFWSFLCDMFVFYWLFGHHKKESFWEQRQRDNQRYDNHFSHDEYEGGDYNHYQHNDHAQQDFDDDIDAGMFDNDF